MPKGVSSSAAPNLLRVWRRILAQLPPTVSDADKQEFLVPLQLVSVTPSELRLQAPTRHLMACVSATHLEAIHDATNRVLGRRQVHVDVATRGQQELFPDAPAGPSTPGRSSQRPMLNPRYTFGTFVVGASNQFAHAAARAVAAQPGEHYNPLFLYGGVGLGKTHLATAIGHAVLDAHPGAHVACLSADTFMNELIAAIRRDRIAAFKRRLRDLDVLIVDDVQLLTGRERTQEEFFHTFNSLHGDRHQIVLTSDTIPRDIRGLEERLRSRLEWGLIADIQPPDVETRVAILQRKAELEDIPLDREVALFLAEHVTSNVRELESALTRLGAEASLQREPITLVAAERMLGTLARPCPTAITFDAIATSVCNHFSLRPDDLRSRRRSRHVAIPRQLAMYFCRRLLDASYPRIGELFARDHTTVIHAVSVTERRLKEDVGFQTTVAILERDIRERNIG